MHDPECTFAFGAASDSSEEVQPELFVQEGPALQALQGSLVFPALEPHTEAVRTLWVRWTQACAPHEVAVSLACSTSRGHALLESRAMVRPCQVALLTAHILSISFFSLAGAAGAACA